jgi:hypothetical protein
VAAERRVKSETAVEFLAGSRRAVLLGGAAVIPARSQPCDFRPAERRNYFFTPRTASFAALATRNLTTVLAGVLIFCCVFGLKPVRAFLLGFHYHPNQNVR